MAVDLTVPPLGESITEAVVGAWHKKVGEPVRADEPLVLLETDKVTVDVPAPADGQLASIAHREGDKVRVGEILGTVSPLPPAQAGLRMSSGHAPLGEGGTRETPQAPGDGRPPQLTPVAKKVAQERGVEVERLRGTGLGGRVLKSDVVEQSPKALPPEGKESGGGGDSPRPPREERVRMTPLRKRVAERLLAAQTNAAILTTFNEADLSAVLALRKQYQEPFKAKHGVKLGFMSFFVRACVDALKAFPQLNAEIDGDEVVFKHYYDIGVAVSGNRGLVVPVIRGADGQSMGDLEKAIAAFAEKARTDRLTLEDLQGGTFTLTNGGIFGSMLSTPILNPPQTGILGMHNIVERPVVRDGQVVIRPIMYLALSYDHRLVDGREAVQFLVRIKECIEDPSRMLLEL